MFAASAHAGSVGLEYGEASISVDPIATGNPLVTHTPEFDQSEKLIGLNGSLDIGPVPIHLSVFKLGDAQEHIFYTDPEGPPATISVSTFTLDTWGARLTARWAAHPADRVELDLEAGVLHLQHRIRVDEFPPGGGDGDHDRSRTSLIGGGGLTYLVTPSIGLRLGGTVGKDWHSMSLGVALRF